MWTAKEIKRTANPTRDTPINEIALNGIIKITILNGLWQTHVPYIFVLESPLFGLFNNSTAFSEWYYVSDHGWLCDYHFPFPWNLVAFPNFFPCFMVVCHVPALWLYLITPFWTKVSHSLCISCVVKQDLVRTIILSSVFSLVRKERRWGEKVNLKMYHTDAEATSIFAVSAGDERLINFYT